MLLNRKKVGPLGGGYSKLKVGRHAYRIVDADWKIVSTDPTGKEKNVVITLTDVEDSNFTCRVFLDVMSSNDVRCRMAQEALVSFSDATGFKAENFKLPDHLPTLKGKTVVVTAKETQGKGDKKDQTYINLSTVEAFEGEVEEDEEEEEDEAPAPKAKAKVKAPEPEPEEEEEADEEEEEEETPKPAAGKPKTRPW